MLTCQRDRFFLDDSVHYLNCAYMSPLPRVVEEAGIAGMRRKRIPTGIREEDFFTESDQLRGRFARLVNVQDPQRIAIIPSVSYGIATAARNIPVHQHDNIVLLGEQFPSNVYTWRRLAASTGAEIRSARAPEGYEERGCRWNEVILEAIDEQTRIVAIPHVHWADGTLFDLSRIGKRARNVGAALIVDATQSVGALPFDVQELQPDALITAGYKWLFGPYSLGLAYFSPRFEEGIPLEENWITRRDSRDFSRLVHYEDAYLPGAVRYDVGERSNFILVPMLNTALRLVLDWTVEEIQSYCRKITRPLIEELRGEGWIIETDAWRSDHLFGLRAPPHVEISAVKQQLDERNVAVSVRGNAVRISPHIYNTKANIAALHEVLMAVTV